MNPRFGRKQVRFADNVNNKGNTLNTLNTLNPPVTPEVIAKEFERRNNELTHNPKYINTIRVRQQQAARLEEELAKQYRNKSCPVSRADKEFINKLKLADPSKLNDLLKNKFQDRLVMSLIGCMMASTIYVDPNRDKFLSRTEAINQWFRLMRRIGAESAYGVATEADWGSVPSGFILKWSQRPKLKSSHSIPTEVDDLLHELIVGFYGTNKLRNTNLHFSYIFAGFQCAPGLIGPVHDTFVKAKRSQTISESYDTKEGMVNKIAVGNCLTDNKVNQVVYEFVKPSIALADAIEKITIDELKNIIIQDLYARQDAFKRTRFVHNDLHPNNVLLRILPQQSVLVYSKITGENNVYLKTNKVVTYIDYGMSYVEFKDVNGKRQQISSPSKGSFLYGAATNIPFPLYDTYKLWLGIAARAYNYKRDDILKEMQKLYTYFDNETTIDDAIHRSSEYYYSLIIPPQRTDILNADLSGVISFVHSVWNNLPFLSSSPTTLSPILRCDISNGLCLQHTKTAMLDAFLANPNGLPPIDNDFLGMIEEVFALDTPERKQFITQPDFLPNLIANLEYSMDAYNAELKQLQISTNKLLKANPLLPNFAINYNSRILDRFFIKLMDLYELVDILNSLNMYSISIERLDKLAKDIKVNLNLTSELKLINSNYNFIINENLLFMARDLYQQIADEYDNLIANKELVSKYGERINNYKAYIENIADAIDRLSKV